ncbi:DEAD/DEAH box helicase [Schaalia sp. lx-260]|uniref:DEAD/DEAH box helicase n=1 Tax=Schaalia sp. lx-260 TaxID=2899082 RepID=UPI001E2CE77C|nr:DEAD/DEAH box helicase [Schaalia sp. lx-260]MCD4549426.1 DEAD/DEAH box helicase [Schaalia sp. lx-260]
MSPARRRRRVVRESAEPDNSTLLSPAERMRAFHEDRHFRSSARHEWTANLPYVPDPFQCEAMDHLESGSSVLVAAPTGAGKTVVGEFAVFLAMSSGQRAFYTTPIKALSNQKFLDLQRIFGAENVGLLTGDTSVRPSAPIVVMTTEVLRNMIYAEVDLKNLSHVILDEVHYLADRMRGPVWEEVIIHLPAHIRIVALSATVSNVEEFGSWMQEVRGSCQVVVWEKRPVPLYQHMLVGDHLFDLYAPSRHGKGLSSRLNPRLLSEVSPLGRARGRSSSGKRETRVGTVIALDRAHMLPAIVFIFSRQGCEDAVAHILSSGMLLTSHDEAARIRRSVDEVLNRIDVRDHAALGVRKWAQALEAGVAAHHAGLLPVMKEAVERLFAQGLVKVVYATETLALGINMPARTVVIESLHKWNGAQHVSLSAGEYTQLSGRAGRRGIDNEGHAVVLHRRQVAPEEVAALASKRTYPLISAFRPTYNMVANLLIHSTRAATREVLETSFAQYQANTAVVHLAQQVRDLQSRMDVFAADMHCDSGDAQEYFALRERIARQQKEGARARAYEALENKRRLFARARTGDIVCCRKGRRLTYYVICDVASTASHSVALVSIGTDGKKYYLSSDERVNWLGIVGRMKIPASHLLRRAQVRTKLAQDLSALIRSGTLSRPYASDSPEKISSTEDLERRLRSHPVHRCPERESHARAGHAWARAAREVERLVAHIDGHTHSVARDFDRVCDVLERMGFLREDHVSEFGQQLTHIFGEHDLVIVEALRTGVFRGLDYAQLAAVASCFVYESRGDEDSAPALPQGIEPLLAEAWDSACRVLARVNEIETEVGAHVSPPLHPGLMAATAAWARGASLTVALSECEVQGGDFVRWMRQVMDVLDQLRRVADEDVAEVMLQARQALAHGVVAWSAL